MAQQVNDNFNIVAGKDVSDKYGKIVLSKTVPYDDVTEANSLILSAYRYIGLPVIIDDGSGVKTYWYKAGITDGDLVLKTHDFSELTNMPTTLVGFGIGDAYTKTQSDAKYIPIAGDQVVSGIKTFSGSLLSPTVATIDNSTNVATTAWVRLQGYGGGGSSVWGSITGTLSNQTDLTNALATKMTANSLITAATKTKITYDTRGLITSGTDATTSDIAEGSNQYFTTARARTALSATGSLSYNSSTGVFSYTTPLALPPNGLAGGQLVGSYPNPSVSWSSGYSTYDSRYVSLTGSYSNPSWITALAAAKVTGLSAVATAGTFASLTGKPTTLAGTGITDVYTKTEVDALVSGGGGGGSCTDIQAVWSLTIGQTLTAGQILYGNPTSGSLQSSELSRIMVVPASGFIKNLWVFATGTQGNASFTVILKKGTNFVSMANTILSVTIPANDVAGVNGKTYSNTVTPVAVNAGDLIDIKFTNNAGTTSLNIISVSMIYTN